MKRSFSFSFSSTWHRSARKGPYALRPVSQQSPQGCPRNNANICLAEHRLFSTLEGGMSAASFLQSSFLRAINALMLWLVRVEKVPQPWSTSALPSCRPDVISDVLASLSASSFPLTPACPGQQIHRSLCSRRLCMAVCQSGQPIPDSTFCRRFIESVRIMTCVIRASHWDASHCIARVTASTSMIRLEVVTL